MSIILLILIHSLCNIIFLVRYQSLRAEHKKKQLSSAGKLWEDQDFLHCKMDQYGRETENPMAVEEKEDDVRVFRA